jgi:hypothetical protein
MKEVIQVVYTPDMHKSISIHRDDESFVKEIFTGYVYDGVETLLFHVIDNPKEHNFGDEILKIEWSSKYGYLVTHKWNIDGEILIHPLNYEYIDVYTQCRR